MQLLLNTQKKNRASMDILQLSVDMLGTCQNSLLPSLLVGDLNIVNLMQQVIFFLQVRALPAVLACPRAPSCSVPCICNDESLSITARVDLISVL